MATDLTISMDDRPGELARVGEALGAAGINIEGLCGMALEGRGVIHLCVMDATAAKAALDGAGLKVEGESDAILADPIGTVNEPGTMGMIGAARRRRGLSTFGSFTSRPTTVPWSSPTTTRERWS